MSISARRSNSGDIAYGISNLRTRIARQQAELAAAVISSNVC